MRGKLAIMAIFLLAAGLTGFAWWWNFTRSYRTREFWGTEHLLAIRYPSNVEGFWLMKPMSDDETGTNAITFQDQRWTKGEPTELTKVPGMLNAIDSLTKDSNYDWTKSPNSSAFSPDWRAGVAFQRPNAATTVLFDFEHGVVGCAETQKLMVLNENTAKGWRSYLERRMPKR